MWEICLNFLIITIILAHALVNLIPNLGNILWILADSNYVNFKEIISSSRCLAHTIPAGIAVNLIKFSSAWKQSPMRECILQCERWVIQKLSYQELWRVAGWVWAYRTTGAEDEVLAKVYYRTRKRMEMRRTVKEENENKTGAARKAQDRHSWKKAVSNRHTTSQSSHNFLIHLFHWITTLPRYSIMTLGSAIPTLLPLF